MLPDHWHLTPDVEDLLTRAGDFLRSRPALHTTPLTDIEKLRLPGAGPSVLGRLEAGGRGPRGLLPHPARPSRRHPADRRRRRHPRRPPRDRRPLPRPGRRRPGHRRRLRLGLAGTHRRDARAVLAHAPLPPRHAHPAPPAPGGPGPGRGGGGARPRGGLVPGVLRRGRRAAVHRPDRRRRLDPVPLRRPALHLLADTGRHPRLHGGRHLGHRRHGPRRPRLHPGPPPGPRPRGRGDGRREPGRTPRGRHGRRPVRGPGQPDQQRPLPPASVTSVSPTAPGTGSRTTDRPPARAFRLDQAGREARCLVDWPERGLVRAAARRRRASTRSVGNRRQRRRCACQPPRRRGDPNERP